jgi:2-octaprenyl-6-methoxyphenol hydroxylase
LPPALHPFAVKEDVEVLVAGGGLIGLLFGVACAGVGLEVAIVDPTDPAAVLDEGFDGRCSAVAYGSYRILVALGLWPQIGPWAEPISNIRVADDESPLFLHYDHRQLETGVPLGYVVENRVLRRVLIERARSLPTLSFLARLAVDSADTSTFAAVVTLSDGRRVRSRLLAAAEGRESRLRRTAGISIVEWRYQQTAIVTTMRHEHPHGGIAVEHFLPAGPFAILPMTDTRSSIVWTERAELAARLIALPDKEFGAELAVRFGDFLGAVKPVGPRWT